MDTFDRRQFLETGAAGLLAATAGLGFREVPKSESTPGPETNAPLDRPISFQSYGVRESIGEDFPGTLERARELGFDGIEMCSPQGSYYQQVGFGHLTDVPPAEISRQIEDAGLFCESCHFQAHELLEDDPAATAEYANELGLTDVIMSGSGLSEDATVDEINRWGERCNEAGEILREAGLRLGYHNHRIGPMVDGEPQYVRIMNALDPELVTMQFQFQAIRYGFDIVYYLKEFAGRYSLLHMADYDPTAHFGEQSRLGSIVPVGEGMIDWSAAIEAATRSDIADHGFVVEMESEQAWEDLETSIENLRSMEI